MSAPPVEPPTNTDRWPAFGTKEAIIEYFHAMNCGREGDEREFLYRLNNTDLTGLTDGATTTFISSLA